MKIKTIEIKKVLLLMLLLSFVALGYGKKEDEEDDKIPAGCTTSGYRFDLTVLNLLTKESGAQQSMYFIYNQLSQPITLFQMRDEESSRSLYLNHTISGRQWAVLSTTEPLVKFICTIPSSGRPYGKVVDCAESVKVCEYSNVRYGLNNRGNYWLVNGNTRQGALREVVRYGIIPAL